MIDHIYPRRPGKSWVLKAHQELAAKRLKKGDRNQDQLNLIVIDEWRQALAKNPWMLAEAQRRRYERTIREAVLIMCREAGQSYRDRLAWANLATKSQASPILGADHGPNPSPAVGHATKE